MRDRLATLVLTIRVTLPSGETPGGRDRPVVQVGIGRVLRAGRACTTTSPGRWCRSPSGSEVAVAGSAFTAATPAFKPASAMFSARFTWRSRPKCVLVRGDLRDDRGGADRQDAHHDQRQHQRDAVLVRLASADHGAQTAPQAARRSVPSSLARRMHQWSARRRSPQSPNGGTPGDPSKPRIAACRWNKRDDRGHRPCARGAALRRVLREAGRFHPGRDLVVMMAMLLAVLAPLTALVRLRPDRPGRPDETVRCPGERAPGARPDAQGHPLRATASPIRTRTPRAARRS